MFIFIAFIHAYMGGNKHNEVSRGFEPRSLDSGSRVLTVTPRDHLNARKRRAIVALGAECMWLLRTPQKQALPCVCKAMLAVLFLARMCTSVLSNHTPTRVLCIPHTCAAAITIHIVSKTHRTCRHHVCGTQKVSRGFEPRSLDPESRVLTVTPRGQVI